MSKRITIKQVAEAIGLSRSTVYRKLRLGATREELINSVPGLEGDFEQAPAENNLDPDDRAAMTWCKAVLWAAENMNEPAMTMAEAGSKLRFSMWEATQKYPKELLIQLVPKALQIIDRNKGDGSGEEMKTAEHKSVQELKELLAGAIEESKYVTPGY